MNFHYQLIFEQVDELSGSVDAVIIIIMRHNSE